MAGARRLEKGLFFQNSPVNNPRQTRMLDLRSMLICLPMSPEDRSGSQVKNLGQSVRTSTKTGAQNNDS